MEKFKKDIKKTHLKYQLQHKMKNLIYLIDCILYQIFNFEYIFKKHRRKTDNPSVRIYLNKIGISITFKN